MQFYKTGVHRLVSCCNQEGNTTNHDVLTFVMRSIGRGRQSREGSWQLLPGRGFLQRAGHTATVVGKHILITGGRNGCVTPLNEELGMQSSGKSLSRARTDAVNRQTFYNDLIRLDTQLLRWDCGFQKPPFQAIVPLLPEHTKTWATLQCLTLSHGVMKTSRSWR